ncbi:hypothetical protein MBLNU459_g2766t3 [Dothideomycetes sp. NU459]
MRAQYAALLALFLDAAAHSAHADVLEAERIERRAANNTVIPAPINVEPSQYWDGNDGPWSSFALQIGTPKQNVRVMVSTAGYATWTVQAAGCPTGTIAGCENARGFLFNTNESLTWVPNSIFDLGLEMNLGLDSTANYGFDTITLGWQGSGLPSVQHSTIASLATFDYWLGIFGLNPQPANFTTLNDPQPSFMTQLKNNNTIPSVAWAYTAGNQYRFDKVYGSLVLGGYDQSKFVPTNLSIPFAGDVSRDLVVGVQSIVSAGQTLTSSGGGFYAFIDSTVSYLYLPQSVCEAFESAFGLTWNDTMQLYLVNSTLHTQLVSQNASVTFTLGTGTSGGQTVDVVLPYAAFDLQVSYPIVQNTSYYFPLKRAANDTQYTLGRTFLQEAYLIADYERRNFTIAPCAWVENAAADLRTIISPNTTISTGGNGGGGGLSAGAIAGVAVGIVAVIALLGLALWLLRRAKNKRKLAELEGASARRTDSQKDSNDLSKPFISGPIGGELGNDSEIHEMQTPWRGGQKPTELDSPHKVVGELEGTADQPQREYFGKVPWGHHEVEGNNTPVYEMQGSEVQELPDNQRPQSWGRGDEKAGLHTR